MMAMRKQNGMQRCFAILLLIGLWAAVSPAWAQQPEPQQPAPPATDPQPSGTKNERDKKETDKAGETVGKSKLEKETGTINDRIFEVMPNYGTVENAKDLPPISTGQKYPKRWGQGWDAYGKRFGASFADNSIGTYMTTAVFPSLLHEDPRYYQLGRGGFRRRAYHAVNRLFVTRTDSGHDRFNYSESVGNAVAAAISNIYHVPEDRTASRNATTFAFLIVYDGLSNGLKEFWPDIRRKVFHKNTP